MIAQLEEEIGQTEKSLAFWSQQTGLEEGGPEQEAVRIIAASYTAQLLQMRSAREMFDRASPPAPTA